MYGNRSTNTVADKKAHAHRRKAKPQVVILPAIGLLGPLEIHLRTEQQSDSSYSVAHPAARRVEAFDPYLLMKQQRSCFIDRDQEDLWLNPGKFSDAIEPPAPQPQVFRVSQ